MYQKFTMRLIVLFIMFLGLLGCETPPSTDQDQEVTSLSNQIEAIQQEFAPDKRVARYQVEAVRRDNQLVLIGETNLPEAHAAMQRRIDSLGWTIKDEVQSLPSADLGGKTYGLINLSAANIRSNPKHSAELATQGMLGMPLRVHRKQDGWYLVQTPDKYFGWLDSGGLMLLTEAEAEAWRQATKVIYQPQMGFSYSGPDKDAPPVSDLLAGNILRAGQTNGSWQEVHYPDGRHAWVPSDELMDYRTWLETRQPDVNNILATAEKFLGRPYLWGGTSGKGVDCSGFTKTVFFLNGLQLPRDASQQVFVGEEIETDTTLKNLQPGDFLFFGRAATPEKKEKITHVAIYQGDGKIIHSSGVVCVQSLRRGDPDFAEHRLKTLLHAKRMLHQPSSSGVLPLDEVADYGI